MRRNRRLLIIAMIILACITLLGIGVIEYYRLENPVFFENYCAYRLNRPSTKTTFLLDYVTNVDDNRSVIDIDFPEADDKVITFFASESVRDNFSFHFSNKNQNSNTKNVGRYTIHTITVSAVPYKDINEPIILTKSLITYNNNEKQEVFIGNIELQPPYEEEQRYFDTYSNYTMNGIVGGIYKAEAKIPMRSNCNITILGIKSQQLPFVKDHLKITLNGTDYEESTDLRLYYGNTATLKAELQIPKDDPAFFNRYNISLSVHYKDDAALEHTNEVTKLEVCPAYDNFWSLVKYLQNKGAI